MGTKAVGTRKLKSNNRGRGRQKALHARLPSTRVSSEAQGAATTPFFVVQEVLPPEDTSAFSAEPVDVVVVEDVAGTVSTRPLTLGEMLAQQPEQDVLFHPCEGCGKPIRGEALHCEECATGLEEAEALSREEKARHAQHMSMVRKGVVVTVLVTIFGSYFWFNDPRSLLDGLLPGIFGPAQEVDPSKVAHAAVETPPSLTVVVAPSGTDTITTLVSPTSQTANVLNTPGLANSATPVATETEPVLPTITNAATPTLVVQEALTAPTVTAEEAQVLASPSAAPTHTPGRLQPTPTRTSQSASTPTRERVSPTATTLRSAAPTRTRTSLPAPTRTPLPASTGTPTPTRVTVAPTQSTVAVPSATRTVTQTATASSLLPTLTPVLPTVTVPLPLPTVSVVPTEVRVPEPTLSVEPTVDVPPLPTVPLPTDVVPTAPLPTAP